ncbi:hypothetical protein D9756_003147 [Leucocoprinus leucothites]|uniref:Uncharacterized protein n=1 Tax=Leucocoprinus leucothites TaxID=201217 RepID=A0A8H5G6A8_9AGAR|nr:hypothetical protein D9756_003147 [Leucoagaricus leucothites]
MLREKTSKPVIGILESAIVQAMLIGQRFGVVTTGTGYKYIHYTEIRNFLGATSERFAGLIAVGLGVVELREGDQQKITTKMKEGSRKIAEKGADVVILGCAGECAIFFSRGLWNSDVLLHCGGDKGMAGMEDLIRQGYVEAGYDVPKVVDGAKSGVAILSGLVRIPS